jgi:arylsulfatase
MPHVPIFASERFKGKSKRGLYGDVIEELDWSMGEVLAALKRLGLDENTLVIFTSDNGPFLSYGNHAGSAAPFRGGKLTTFEGGMRMPCLMRWPGHIPAGRTCDELITAMDLYPTLAGLTGAKTPDVKRDGRDIWPLMSGAPDAKSPHEAFYYYAEQELHAVRSGKWKLHFPHPYIEVDGPPGRDGKPANFEHMKPADHRKSGIEGVASRHGYKIMQMEMSLFDLESDPGESKNVASEHPEVVKRLGDLAESMRSELGDGLTGRKASGARQPGHAK